MYYLGIPYNRSIGPRSTFSDSLKLTSLLKQDVDYIERSCNVKWFQTFSPGASTEPSFLKSSEDSVYDLKDHPDFQYRPGTVVIRCLCTYISLQISVSTSVSDPDPDPTGFIAFGRIRIHFNPRSGSRSGSGFTSISFLGSGST